MKCEQTGRLSEKGSPLTVYTAGQDTDTSPVQREVVVAALQDTVAQQIPWRPTQTPLLGRLEWDISRPDEVQHKSLGGIKWQGHSCRSASWTDSQLWTAWTLWMCVFQGERKLEVDREQQLAPEWAAVHESD